MSGMRVLAAPGVRTRPSTGLRAAVGASAAVVRRDPGLWLLGALSFTVRGGIVLFLLPVVWIPSPVLLSIYLGGYFTTSGLSGQVGGAAVVGGAVAGAIGVAAVLLAGYAQLATFERVASRPETTDLRGDRLPIRLRGRRRATTVLLVAGLNALGLVPLALLLGPIATRIGTVGVQELQFPTSLDTPFAITVLGRVRDELLLLAAVVVVMELIVTLAVHQLLAARLGLVPARRIPAAATGISRLAWQPVRTLVLAILGWLGTMLAVAVGLGSSLVAWDTLRLLLFRSPTADPAGSELAVAAQIVLLVVFAVVWIAAITFAGVASSFRGALWSTNALH